MKIQLKKIIIVINCLVLFSSQICYSVCEKPVKLLNQGDSAPCTGYLFSPDKNRELFIINEEHKIFKKQLEIKDLMINNLDKNIKLHEEILDKSRKQTDIWETKAKESTEQLFKVQESQGKRDFMFILLGVGLTVFAGWAVGQAK